MSRTAWQAAADELAEAHSRRAIDDEQWFSGMAAIFEAAYLEGDNPRAQSGFGGDEVAATPVSSTTRYRGYREEAHPSP